MSTAIDNFTKSIAGDDEKYSNPPQGLGVGCRVEGSGTGESLTTPYTPHPFAFPHTVKSQDIYWVRDAPQ